MHIILKCQECKILLGYNDTAAEPLRFLDPNVLAFHVLLFDPLFSRPAFYVLHLTRPHPSISPNPVY